MLEMTCRRKTRILFGGLSYWFGVPAERLISKNSNQKTSKFDIKIRGRSD